MPKSKRKKAYAESSITSFGGLRDDADAGSLGAVAIRNFQFRPDRTLEKRSGYLQDRSFSYNLRALWQSSKGNFAGRFFLADKKVYYEDSSGVLRTFGEVQNASGPANFFVYRGYLYLADSSHIYFCNLSANRFSQVYGYAPLFGNGWDPTTGAGSINEPFNLLSPRIRILYQCPSGTQLIRLPFPAVSVDAVTSGGVSLAHSFTSGSRSLTLTSATAATTVEVAMTLDSSYAPLRSSILSCTIPCSFQKGDQESLYLTGGAEGCRVFSAASVSDSMLQASKRAYSDSDPLYFKSTGAFLLSDQAHPLTAFARHNNRVIVFGTSGAWSLSRAAEGDTVEAYFLDSCPGCLAREGAITIGEELLVMAPSGLSLLKANSIDKDQFFVTPLCRELSKSLAGFDLSKAHLFFDPLTNRIFLRDTTENREGLVYVYDRTLGLWSVWDDVFASHFYGGERGILFFQGKKLFRFSDLVFLDNGTEYAASYQSGAIHFDSPETYKRALRVFCEVSASEEDLQMEIATESGSAVYTRACTNGSFPTHHECRVPTSRFRNFSYRISFSGHGQAILHRVGFCCNL